MEEEIETETELVGEAEGGAAEEAEESAASSDES